MSTERSSVLVRAMFVLVLLSPTASSATTWWVSGTGSDSNNGLTESAAFRTITHAMSSASTGDTINVKSGTYNDAVETFPIAIKNDVDIIGVETSTSSYPQIGGDVNDGDSSVAAIFRIDATSSAKGRIEIKYLTFVAENYSGKDAPSALLVQTAGGWSVTGSYFDGCIVKRLEMSDPNSTDRAALEFEAGKGTLEFEVKNCTINASTLGGIDVRVGSSANSETNKAVIPITVRNTTVEARQTEYAEFGIRYRGTGELWADFKTKTIACTIDSTNVANSSYGALNGLILAAEPTGSAAVLFRYAECDIQNNVIKGNRSAGVLIKASSGTATTSDAHFQLDRFMHNDVRKNAGAGVRIDWGTTGTQRYILFLAQNNVIVENQYGYYTENFNDSGGTSSGFSYSSSDTVANNTYYGYYNAAESGGTGGRVGVISDGVVWGNNGGGAQYNYGSGWDPCVKIEYSDVQGLSLPCDPVNFNLNANPLFVDASNGNFHLDGTSPGVSPCIDVGDSTPSGPASLTGKDIDGHAREQDSDDNGSITVDMGADEVPDPNP
jgi:hypothetical protein